MPPSNISYLKNEKGNTFKLEIINYDHPKDLDNVLTIFDDTEVIEKEYYFAPDEICIKMKGLSGHVANLYHDASFEGWKKYGDRDSLYMDIWYK